MPRFRSFVDATGFRSGRWKADLRFPSADPEQTPGFILLIHINADDGDGGKFATASTVSTQREAMARYVAGLTKFIQNREKAEPDWREHGGRLWPLRAAVHSDGVAQCRHVPHGRRSRRRRNRSAALRRSIAGRTTRTSTKRPGCCGRSSRNTAGKSPGPTS